MWKFDNFDDHLIICQTEFKKYFASSIWILSYDDNTLNHLVFRTVDRTKQVN